MSEVKVKVVKGEVIAGKGEAFAVGAECVVSKADADALVAAGVAEVVVEEKAAKSAKKDDKPAKGQDDI